MARFRKRSVKNRDKENTGDDRDKYQNKDTYRELIKENQSFVDFYQKQKIFSDEEFLIFYEILKTPLPTTFRVSDARILPKLELFLEKVKEIKNEEEVEIFPINWYTNKMAYHISLTRKVIRSNPLYGAFHKFLINETEIGVLARQEAVSMIPPLILDVKSHHFVLDMCAAPGSKTCQLIESLHAGTEGIPSGMVIANDADNKRAYLLVHQTKKLASPCLIVTNHDASMFPTIWMRKDERLEFDRILCDVPCSGDGTFRKNVELWNKWSPSGALGLHALQMRILERGVKLLKVGGRIAYSTCSFNPIENEAVVSAILKKYKNCIRILSMSNELPNLKRRPGLLNWVVTDRNGHLVDSPSGKILKTMFPLPQEELKELGIEQCFRLVPQDQNTGGFFVCLIEKYKDILEPEKFEETNIENDTKETEIQVEAETEVQDAPAIEAIPDQNDEEDKENKRLKLENDNEIKLENDNGITVENDNGITVENDNNKVENDNVYIPRRAEKGFKEEPFIFLDKEKNEFLKDIENYYGMHDFPFSQCLVRSESQKTVYFVNEAVKSVLLSRNRYRIIAINTGIKVLAKCDEIGDDGSKINFRLVQESIGKIQQYISSRRVAIDKQDLILLMNNERVSVDQVNAILQAELKNISPGSILLVEGLNYVVGWKGKSTIQAMVIKQEKSSFLSHLEPNKDF